MNRLMRTLLPACAALVLLLGGQQLVAAPPAKGGGTKDTTPPATVTDLEVTPTVRALTLKFTATGDDGTSGTAVRYDVRYRTGINCDADDPQSWTRAARSIETTAEAPGTVDYFTVRAPEGLASHGLTPATRHCVAIRVLDEVDRPVTPEMWARAETSTLSGDWRLVALPAAPVGAVAQHAFSKRAVVDPDDPTRILLGWVTQDINGNVTIPGALRFASLAADIGKSGDQSVPECSEAIASGCVETVPNDWKKFFDQSTASGGRFVATFHEVPGTGKVGAFFVRGVKAGSVTRKNSSGDTGAIVIERDSNGLWTIVGDNNDGAQPLNDPAFIPFSPDGQTVHWSTLAYASDGAGVFMPAVAWRAVAADTPTYQKAVVNYAERSEAGWSNPTVLSARETGGGSFAGDLFRRRHLFNKPDGTLAILIDGSEGLMHTIYAERVPVADSPGEWQWRHYLIDPRRNDQSRIAYDGQGRLVLADGWYATSQVSLFREPDGVVWQGETSTTPLPSYDFRSPIPFEPLNSWTMIYEDQSYPNALHFRVAGASVDACGNAHVASAMGRISGNGMGETWEQRALTASEAASFPALPAAEERIDATTGSGTGLALMLPDGDRIVGYDWGYVGGFATSYSPRPANYVYLARSGTGCSPAP